MSATSNLVQYTREIGINIAELSRKAGIPYQTCYEVFGEKGRGRELKADEFLTICAIIKVNPMDFRSVEKEDASEE